VKKHLFWALGGLFLITASLAATKSLQIETLIQHGKHFIPPPATVTVAEVKTELWPQELDAVGTLTAVQGVTIAAELPGKVTEIAFQAGASVRKGDLLIRQDTSVEEAQLPGALAAAELARINRDRADRMFAADSIRATIGKKTLRAPFSGRLGVRQVNLGQLLGQGDAIVTLQALDPIFVDFSLPQQRLAQVRAGLPVQVTCDALPGRTVRGSVTAINPLVDADTRNLRIEATVGNRDEQLRPGMFVNVALSRQESRPVRAIPATAVLYAPYSDSVFVLDPGPDGKGMVLRQQLVTLGDRRGDLVAVAKGLEPGERVVSTGVFKLRNGMPVVVDNQSAPAFQQSPTPAND